MIDKNKIIEQAKKELKEESYRRAVDKMKERLKRAKWYHKLFPYKIVLIKRSK